uniref:hypothetical protein n=1 Tax=uncultured Draconibacterium sp. TaxID=1573823 RepID=UPI003217BBF9
MPETTFASSSVLITSIGSVVGGMLGAYFIHLLSKLKSKTINVYHVNNETNRGDDAEQMGEPMHRTGIPVTLDNKRLWKWTNDLNGNVNYNSIIYGPYSHDLNLPGKYRVEFLIKGNGFKPNDDRVILIVDVTGIVFRNVPLYNENGEPILDKDNKIQTRTYTESFRVYGSRKIRKMELSDGKWNTFSVDVYSSGSANLYEYRVRKYNFYELDSDEEVYFDTIKIKKTK